MDFLIHWPPGPVVATVQCQGLAMIVNYDCGDNIQLQIIREASE